MRRYWVRLFIQKVPQHIDSDYHEILSQYSTYYNGLRDDLKRDFRKRLYKLLNVMAFSSPNFKVVNREMRAVIGASLIEITFGLKGFLPSRFLNVIVLPRRYMYPGYGEPFLGHIDYDTNTLYFSWEDVKEGYRLPNDAMNVALHEMAHVFETESKYHSLFARFFNKVSWAIWAKLAFDKMQVIRSGQNRFLKNYGGTNMKEMFAVCVEAFFEQSESFKAELPEIYGTLVDLLNQDPTNKENPKLKT